MQASFSKADREAWITLALYLFFFVWWTAFAFGLGRGDPEAYTYILGLPAWFFMSCVVGWPTVTILLWIVVHRCFSSDSLEDAGDE